MTKKGPFLLKKRSAFFLVSFFLEGYVLKEQLESLFSLQVESSGPMPQLSSSHLKKIIE